MIPAHVRVAKNTIIVVAGFNKNSVYSLLLTITDHLNFIIFDAGLSDFVAIQLKMSRIHDHILLSDKFNQSHNTGVVSVMLVNLRFLLN